ncbi:hypothetical protein [Nostoc sp. MS1]|uniref:hypothetical protein n=1 Tax=Nostoc sp. MS1 TaxID=2764711 RepID=UPI001CC49F12|nr:hypothetical protein [Nostoc sp. MS1]BCL39184.1 hypothetical protein NSMS1_56310 [Nostoc sp. MS1]
MKKLLWLSTLGLAIAATSLPALAQTQDSPQTPGTQSPELQTPGERQTPGTQTPNTPAPGTQIPDTQTPAVQPGTQIQPTTPSADATYSAPRIKGTSALRDANYISLYTGSQPLTYVTILPPDYISIGDNITVTDQSGQNIQAKVTREGDKVRVNFAQPVAPGSTLEIALTDLAFGYPYPSKSTFNYELAGGYTGFNREIPYGLAQFQVY